jgi:hypothetical protein
MSELRPCNACRRHLSISETSCPFCGTAREVEQPVSMRFGRASRAAVFAGAALASTACGGKKPAAQTVDNHANEAQADAGVATPPDRGNGSDPNDPNNPNNIPMPYGAPPARRRVV